MKNIVKKASAAIKTKTSVPKKSGKTSLTTPSTNEPLKQQPLPNATIIYGIGASLFFIVALSSLLSGKVFTGSMLLLIGGCLMGFALHLLKHQD